MNMNKSQKCTCKHTVKFPRAVSNLQHRGPHVGCSVWEILNRPIYVCVGGRVGLSFGVSK
jgi:hypothetical protein